ncbi:MAG: hypothetical protein GEU88_11010 [Solirubrobacterales bacterium]|nr:hypothetical protein [Solirubrobacterales bacterium]
MRRDRAWALAGAALAGALAVLVILLALDVSNLRNAMADGDLRQATGSPSSDAWDGHPRLPGDAAERLLGLGDDLAFRRAAALFSVARPGVRTLPPDEIASARSRALRALTETAANRDEPERAAQAANLAGILAAEAPGEDRSGPGPADTALEAFRSSILLNPRSEHAKRNLELLLRSQRARRKSEGPARQEGRFGRSPGGAGLSPPGEGY